MTMTIEEIGAALGDPFAHLAPWATNVDDPQRPGELVSALWWAVWTDLEGIGADEPLYAPAGRPEVYAPTRWIDSDGHGHVLAGPTREAALEEATRAIRAGRFATVPDLVAQLAAVREELAAAREEIVRLTQQRRELARDPKPGDVVRFLPGEMDDRPAFVSVERIDADGWVHTLRLAWEDLGSISPAVWAAMHGELLWRAPEGGPDGL